MYCCYVNEHNFPSHSAIIECNSIPKLKYNKINEICCLLMPYVKNFELDLNLVGNVKNIPTTKR